MSIVAGPAQHIIVAVNFARKQYTVTVKRQKGVFQLIKGLKVKGISNPNGWIPMVSVAPGNIISVLYETNPGIITVIPFGHLRMRPLEADGLVGNLPLDAVLTEPWENIHTDGLTVTPEHSRKTIPEGNHCAVKNTV